MKLDSSSPRQTDSPPAPPSFAEWLAPLLHPLPADGGLSRRGGWFLAALAGLLAILFFGVVAPFVFPDEVRRWAQAKPISEIVAPSAGGYPAGTRLRDCRDDTCPWMVVVPAGSFMMGSPASEPGHQDDEGPQHRVSISKFAMGQYEVTQGQWKALMGSNPSGFKDCGDECPVEQVSWDDAQEFVKKLNAKTGKTYRLPSEAEWEYAARAGTTTAYSFGATLSASKANCGEGAPGKTVAVGRYAANNFGLSDMHGNVYEWTGDWNAPYQAGEVKDPVVHQDKKESRQRVLRGGSWIHDGRLCRSAIRLALVPDARDYDVGFRLARGLAD